MTSDNSYLNPERDKAKAAAAHGSELERRADELRDVARACATINDFARAAGFSMEVARHARSVLNLDLPDAKLQAGKRTEARAVPKPTKKKP